MRIFLVKVKAQALIEQILQKKEFVHDGIYNFSSDIKIGDLVFIYFGGDKSLISWEQGIRGVGRITATPYQKGYDRSKPRNFKIKITPIDILPHSIPPKTTKIHPQYSGDVYDIPYVGANHFPNQAIASYDDKVGISSLIHIYNEYGDYNFHDFKELDSLITKNTTIEMIDSYTAIASVLESKRFLILTGLSGSGKTMQALKFAKWITAPKKPSILSVLKKVTKSKEIVDNYEVIGVSEKIVELKNRKGSSGKIIPIPTPVIYEYYQAFVDGVFKEGDDTSEVREKVKVTSSYQKHIHGFWGDCIKLAILMGGYHA